jgi:hypothetical protein
MCNEKFKGGVDRRNGIFPVAAFLKKAREAREQFPELIDDLPL